MNIQEISQLNTTLKTQITVLETQHRQSLDKAIEETDLKLQHLQNECDSLVSDLRQKNSITESNLHKSTESNRRLTRQVPRRPHLRPPFPSKRPRPFSMHLLPNSMPFFLEVNGCRCLD